MHEYEKLGSFYLGRPYDLSAKQPKQGLVLYDSKDLVTHAVCVGMTGSGKTGLCIGLLEEAAIDGVPALVIDPKGDLGNLLLTFPELRAEDFRPWVNEDDARRSGVSVEDFAGQQATMWREGLARWGQAPERIARLREAAEFSIYTPGSDSGIPVSVLRSFAVPPEAVREDRETFREHISGTVSALLGLAGIEADPIQSREHILLSNILGNAWQQGQELDLGALIQQIQVPPMTRIGVLDVDSFYPAKERFALAMALNNLLASPGFEAWMQGEPLEIDCFLYTPSGKPRISIFSIAHLNDAERMFFVSLLLNQTVGWMRQQSGTTSLRAIVYMDEIFGYFPPVSNPPSKLPLLTLLKQARAFGVGVVLATQNPVDLDYKGLANCGTWFIGRLQTEQDKERVLDGLEGAAANSGGALGRQKLDEVLSGLGNRIFLLNNVHEDQPEIFETRWALSYLRGPLARTQIRELMRSRKAPEEKPAHGTELGVKADVKAPKPAATEQRPVLPPDITQFFLPVRRTGGCLFYEAALLGMARVRFTDVKCKLDRVDEYAFVIAVTGEAVPVLWDQAMQVSLAPSDLEKEPPEAVGFSALPSAMSKGRNYTGWSRDFVNWITANQKIELFRSPSLRETSAPGESEREFRIRIQHLAHEQRDEAAEKLRLKYAPKMAALEDRIRRAEAAVAKEEAEAQDRTFQSAINIGSTLLGAFLGQSVSRRAGSSLSSISRARKDAIDVGRATEQLEALHLQHADLQRQFSEDVAAVTSKLNAMTEDLETVVIRPKKTNVSVTLFALAWVPYVRDGNGVAAAAWE